MHRFVFSLIAVTASTLLLRAQSEADRLKSALATAATDSSKIAIYISLHDVLAEVDTTQSKDYLLKALALGERNPNKTFVCRVYLKLSKHFRQRGKLSDAKHAQMKVAQACSEIKMIEAALNSERGILNQLEGKYDSAVHFFLKALAIDESMGNDEKSANSLNNIANIYWELERFDDALDYYNRALSIYENSGNEKETGDILGNIGLIYRSKNNYEKALEYYNKSLAIDRKYGNRLSEAINLQNIAVLYTKTNDTDKAMEFMMASNALSRKIDDQIGVLYTDHGIATIYFDRGDYDKAITALQSALLLAQKLNIKEEIKDLYESLALAYEKKNGFKTALEYRKKFEVAKDSLSGESFATRIKELEVKYESEKKDKRITLLAKEKELQATESKRQATLKNAFIIGFLLVVLLASVITYSLRQRMKSQALLASKMAELNDATFKQRLGELEMKALRAQINPHFLFNCMNSINRMILSGDNENASIYLTKLSKFVRLILENTESNRVSLESELSLVESYIQMEELRFKGRIDYEITVDQSVETDNAYLPPMVLQPFVENAIWHGLMHKEKDRPGQIKIGVKENNEALICTIEDNGVGRIRSQELQDKNMFKTKSMGIKITEDRLKLLTKKRWKELIRIVDLKDAYDTAMGTRVEISIPLV